MTFALRALTQFPHAAPHRGLDGREDGGQRRVDILKTLHGHQRRDQLVALRSLFTWAERQGLIFRSPTSRITIGHNEYAVLQPLLPEQVKRSVAAATAPAARLVPALAAGHAARGGPDRRSHARRR
ncbi:hypothetical protein L0F81_36510 [Streptomyces tricolor]|uniref:Integrase n=1 Tax=Streptomyces tricolor TaxID=68277 RepID=A0ABS9JT04_9ACTN|nr:hypothetical protein [Streptomyces tricolor]MCG0068709.1 hypothetical protein [Streptomyces tricolor]